MDADGGVELRLGDAALHGDAEALDDLAGLGADHVRAEHAVARAIDDELHEGLLVAAGQGVPQRLEARLEHEHVAVALARLLFGEADGADARRAEDGGRARRGGRASWAAPPKTVRAKQMPSCSATGVRLMRSVTSPIAHTLGTLRARVVVDEDLAARARSRRRAPRGRGRACSARGRWRRGRRRPRARSRR